VFDGVGSGLITALPGAPDVGSPVSSSCTLHWARIATAGRTGTGDAADPADKSLPRREWRSLLVFPTRNKEVSDVRCHRGVRDSCDGCLLRHR
jgi:hypothetical protein